MIRGELIEDLAVLERYRDRWDRLAVELSSPFCAPAWALSWWRHAGPASARLRVIVALDGDELVGIAPFYFDRWGLRLRRYSFLGAEESWRVEPLARPDVLDEVAAVFATKLEEARPRPDVLRFHNVPTESPWPELLVRLWPGDGRRPRIYHDAPLPSPTATLEPKPLDAWLGSKSRGFRQQVRRRRRQLEERGGVSTVSTTADDLERDLDSFFSLHFGRWEKRGGSWAGRHGIEQAMRTAARELFDESRLRIACVRVDGDTIAAAVIISAGDEATYWLGGFDDKWAAQSPGILALVTAVEDALERKEVRFDLGPGEQDYKYRFADGEDQLRPVNVVPHSGRYPLVRLQLGARSLRVSLRERSIPVPRLRRSGELQSALH